MKDVEDALGIWEQVAVATVGESLLCTSVVGFSRQPG